MIFRNLDNAHDWTFGQGLSNYLAGDAAIGLNIETRILSWLNDCFFDMAAGIDWVNRLGSKNQRALLEADLRRIIMQSYGVAQLNSITTAVNNRVFTATYSITTINNTNYQNSVSRGF